VTWGTGRRLGTLALALMASAWTWRPLLDRVLIDDDYMLLFQLRNRYALEAVLQPTAGHPSVIRNGVALVLDHLVGPNPRALFAVVLLTHLVNVSLLYALVLSITRNALLAFAGSLAFGVSPVAGGALGWYAVYGHVLATTAVLAALLWAARLAPDHSPSARETAVVLVAALIATFCFGVGFGMALALPFAFVLLRAARAGQVGWLVVVVPVVVMVSAWTASWLSTTPPAPEGISALQILANQGWRIPGFLFDLVGYGFLRFTTGALPLPHDAPIAIRAGCLAAIGVALAALWRAGESWRRWIGVAALLLLGGYGAVALGRFPFWSFEAPVAATWTRYHYATLPFFSLVLVIVLGTFSRRWRNALAIAWVATLVLAQIAWPPRLPSDAVARVESDRLRAWISARINQAPPGEDVVFSNRLFHGAVSPAVPLNAFPGTAGAFVVYYPDNVVNGHRVRFAERNPEIIEWYSKGRRTADLFVAVGESVPNPRP
jgi:hypothetical protein